MTTHRSLSIFLAMAVCAAGFPAAADDRAPAGDAKAAPTQAPIDVTAGQIAADPAGYSGRSVRVKAEVEDVHGLRAFTLDEDRIGAEPDVLVLAPDTVPRNIENKNVTVTGPVRIFARVQLERDYEWFDADDFGDPDLLARFETRPVIVARSIRDAEGHEIVTAGGSARKPAAQRQPEQNHAEQ